MFVPEALVAHQPLHRFFHRRGRETARHRAPRFLACDETRLDQDVEMFHHGGQRHRERLRQRAHRKLALLRKAREQRAPCGVGKRCKGAVQRVVFMLNHAVKHRKRIREVKHEQMGREAWRKKPHGPRRSKATRAVQPAGRAAGSAWPKGRHYRVSARIRWPSRPGRTWPAPPRSPRSPRSACDTRRSRCGRSRACRNPA